MTKDDHDRSSKPPMYQPAGSGLSLPSIANRGPLGNLLGRLRGRDQITSIAVDTERKQALSKNMEVTQELLNEATKTKLAVDHYQYETPLIIAEQRAILQHEREERDRQRKIETARSYSDLTDIEARNERSRERRKLNDETLIARAATKKTETETTRKVAQSTDEERQRARIQAEIDAYNTGDLNKLRALQFLDRERAGGLDTGAAEPEDRASDLDLQLEIAEQNLGEAMDSADPDSVISFLAQKVRKLKSKIEKAQAGAEIP